MSDNHLTCAECDELFPGYFEGELEAARRGMIDAHAASCARCQRLIRDFDAIRREAAALPELVPSHDLWKGIEARIQSRVVSIGERRDGRGISRRLIGLAAAALVVVSSSLTYLVTKGGGDSPARPVRVVEQPRDVPVAGSTDEIGSPASSSVEPATAPSAEAEAKAAGATPPEAPAPKTVPTRQPSAGRTNTRVGAAKTSLASTAVAPKSPSELAIAPEIAKLQQVIRQRRDQLDPATVRIVEDNLNLIDAAVKQAEAALARDPGSGFLTDQLDNALQKKVQLLRTAALLPSRS